MKFLRQPHLFLVGLLLAGVFCANRLRANVYATDIRLNGSLGPAQIMVPSNSVTISYVLNEPATDGVMVEIFSGTNLVKTFSSDDGEAGTNEGTNSVVWDGSMDSSTNSPEGAYTISITAAAAGYSVWTNIAQESTNITVIAPHGITVDNNTNSPYYGRVFVANAADFNQQNYTSGFYKFNADGSPAEEGGFTTGGFDWGYSGFSPWKMTVGTDDRLYVDDFSEQGVVDSFDPMIDHSSFRQVLTPANYPPAYPNLLLSGLAFASSGTNAELLMTDCNTGGSAGIISWQLTGDGAVSTNDQGSIVVPIDPYFLTQAPWDLAIDTNDFLYAAQLNGFTNTPIYPLLSYPPSGGSPETTPDWAIAMYPELTAVYGLAVNPAGTLVAVTTQGGTDPEGRTGGLYLFDAVTGDFITNLDQTGGDAYFDAAWDNVGNLYATDDGNITYLGVWHAYSPPGPNQSTTFAVPVIQAYDTFTAPMLASPQCQTNQLRFSLQGQSNVTYVIQRSCDLTNWVNVCTNYSANDVRSICVRATRSSGFFRAVTAP